MSGFLKGYLKGEELHIAATYANACGALVVSRHGCTPAMPSWTELESFISRQDLKRPDLDDEINDLHRTTTGRTSFNKDLFILAFDHRSQFLNELNKEGIKDLSEEIYYQQSKKVVIIISTVLPGTIRREIKPIIDTNPYFKLCYNPFFIAMGTTMRDFLDPEMVLFGVDDSWAAKKAKKFYRTLHHSPFYETTIETAELTKVTYNTFISTKISFVNTVMEMCDKLPNTNVDDVMNALKMCDDRIISDKYLSGGMGDGGGCHPRDNIALSWLSKKLDLSHDWFDNIMMQRENQTDWLADLIEEHSNGLPINILGKSFKPETNITTGSPSILLKNILEERGHPVFIWDPYVDEPWEEIKRMYDDSETESQLYFIGTKHPDFTSFPYEKGSVIIDPWRYIPKQDSCEVIHIGDSIDS